MITGARGVSANAPKPEPSTTATSIVSTRLRSRIYCAACCARSKIAVDINDCCFSSLGLSLLWVILALHFAWLKRNRQAGGRKRLAGAPGLLTKKAAEAACFQAPAANAGQFAAPFTARCAPGQCPGPASGL